jgi:hypothetical protein
MAQSKDILASLPNSQGASIIKATKDFLGEKIRKYL